MSSRDTALDLPRQFEWDSESESYQAYKREFLTKDNRIAAVIYDEVIADMPYCNEMYINGARGTNKSFGVIAGNLFDFLHLKEFSFAIARKYSVMIKNSLFPELQKVYQYFCDWGIPGCKPGHVGRHIIFNTTALRVYFLDKEIVVGATDNPSSFKGITGKGRQSIKRVAYDEVLEKPKENTSEMAPEVQEQNIQVMNMTCDRGETRYLNTMRSNVSYVYNADDPVAPMARKTQEAIPTGDISYDPEIVRKCEENEAYLKTHPFIKVYEDVEAEVPEFDGDGQLKSDENGVVYHTEVIRRKFLHLSYLAGKASTRSRDYLPKMVVTERERPNDYRIDYLGAWITRKTDGFTYWAMPAFKEFKTIEIDPHRDGCELYAGLDPATKDMTAVTVCTTAIRDGREHIVILYFREYKMDKQVQLQQTVIKDILANPRLRALTKGFDEPLTICVDPHSGAYDEHYNEQLANMRVTANITFEKRKMRRSYEKINARVVTVNSLLNAGTFAVGTVWNEFPDDRERETAWIAKLLEEFRFCRNNPTTLERDERGGRNKLDGINSLEYGTWEVWDSVY